MKAWFIGSVAAIMIICAISIAINRERKENCNRRSANVDIPLSNAVAELQNDLIETRRVMIRVSRRITVLEGGQLPKGRAVDYHKEWGRLKTRDIEKSKPSNERDDYMSWLRDGLREKDVQWRRRKLKQLEKEKRDEKTKGENL